MRERDIHSGMRERDSGMTLGRLAHCLASNPQPATAIAEEETVYTQTNTCLGEGYLHTAFGETFGCEDRRKKLYCTYVSSDH